jgi:hypothetical protein
MAQGKKSKSKGKQTPQNRAATPAAVPPELLAIQDEIRRLVGEDPAGWATFAQALKAQNEAEPDVMFEFVAKNLGKEALPLLRGAALDEDEEFALGALKALPALASRAAGDVLAEAYAAYPEGERGKSAWQGVQALQARGIKVTVPEPEGVRQQTPTYQLREIRESFPDGVGSSEVLMRLQDRYGVWYTCAVVWNDQAGVKDGFLTPFSRPHWEQMRRTQQEQGVDLITVPEEYARWHVLQARAINDLSGFPLEDHLEPWDELFGPPSTGYAAPDPLAPLRELPAAELAELADDIERLMTEGIFNTWAFEPADVQPFYEKYRPLADQVYSVGPDEEPEAETYAAFKAVLAEAGRAVTTPEMDARFRERLLDVARKLEWQGRDADARVAAAAALQIETSGDPGGTTFYQELVANGFELLEEILQDGENPEELRYDPMERYSDTEGEEE